MEMGKGIELARQEAPLHAAVLDDFKDQLLLALIRRLGGKVSIPATEVDETGGYLLAMNIADGGFNFELVKKQ
jgi:hypothetical protein